MKAIQEYNEVLRDIARENGVSFVDTYSVFSNNKEANLSNDGVHPNEKGYQLLFEHIKPVIEKYL